MLVDGKVHLSPLETEKLFDKGVIFRQGKGWEKGKFYEVFSANSKFSVYTVGDSFIYMVDGILPHEITEKTVFVGTRLYPFKRMKMSHMVSKDLDALHRMADKIGMKRGWFQDKKSDRYTPHYDVSLSMKKKALQFGAIQMNDRILVDYVFEGLRTKYNGNK